MGTYTKYNITRHISTVYTTHLTQIPIWNELILIVNSVIIRSGLWYTHLRIWVEPELQDLKSVYIQLAWCNLIIYGIFHWWRNP